MDTNSTDMVDDGAANGAAAAAVVEAPPQPQRLLLDALPYLDTQDAQTQEQVQALLQEEMSSLTRTPEEYLAEFMSVRGYTQDYLKFETPPLAAGFALLSAGRPAVPALDSTRASLIPPAASAPLSAWRDAVDAAQAQIELQSTRQANLELLKKYGAAAWRTHNDQLTAVKNELASAVAAAKNGSDLINRKRKAEQTAVGSDLALLDSGYFQLVAKNHAIELACARMQQQVDSQGPPKQQRA